MKLDPEKVRRARESLGYSIETTGEKGDLSPNSVLRAEHGEEIRPSTARRLAQALNIEVADLYPKVEAPTSSTPAKAVDEERRSADAGAQVPQSMDALLKLVGAKTRFHELPEVEFEALWDGKTHTERVELNKKFLEERDLILPVLASWKDMTASKDRTQLHDLWFEAFKRIWMAMARNKEAAEVEAAAARREGDEDRAKRVLEEAEEFGKAA